MRVFGLTGGIASGKSTVSRLFASWGVPIIDADLISHEVVRRGTKAHLEIVKHFGLTVLQADDELDRKALGRIVFADADKRQLLNSIVHPAIADRTAAMIVELNNRGEHLACYDAPLLLENNLQVGFRPVVVVTVPESVQVQRIMVRNSLTEAEAQARIASQMPQWMKVGHADVIIDNDADLPTLEARARKALDEVRRLVTRVP